jgi:hypothetical protein
MANLKGILTEYEQTRVMEGEDQIHAHIETSAGHFLRMNLKSDGSSYSRNIRVAKSATSEGSAVKATSFDVPTDPPR